MESDHERAIRIAIRRENLRGTILDVDDKIMKVACAFTGLTEDDQGAIDLAIELQLVCEDWTEPREGDK